MVFRFEHADWPVDDNIRRAAREEFDSAMAEVVETGFEVHGTVRNVRRRLKRVRAILRLIRPAFADYAAENARLRDIGAAFSQLRDAMALVEAVDFVLADADEAEEAVLDRVRAGFVARAASAEAALDRDAMLGELRGTLRDARVRSELWEIEGSGKRALVPGLVAAYRKGRQAQAAAEASGAAEALHDFRKHAKYHLAHLSLLRDMAPIFADERRRQMQKLARRLGDFQNLSVLAEALSDEALPIEPGDRETAVALVLRRRERLGRRALQLGARLFAEKPRTVAARWETYWADWNSAQSLRRA